MRTASPHNVQFEVMLAVIGWRGVNLSWAALGLVARMIPSVADTLADLEGM